MADVTPNYSFPFLEYGDPPDLAAGTEDLAMAVDAKFVTVDAAVAAITTPAPVTASNSTTEGPYTGTTYTAGTATCGTAFTAPPSGMVLIHLKAYFQQGINDQVAIVSTEIRTGSTLGSGTVVGAANFNDALVIGRVVTTGVESVMNSSTPRLITGMTSGASYNVRVLHQTTSGGNITLFNRQLIVVPIV